MRTQGRPMGALALAAGLVLLLLASACNNDEQFAGIPEELAEAALVTMEGGYTLTVTVFDDEGDVREELEIQRIGVDRVRRISSVDPVAEVVAVDHTAYTEDQDNPGRFLRAEISSPTALDPAYLILDSLPAVDEVVLHDGAYNFVVTGEEVGGRAEVSARVSEGRISEMSVATPRGRSTFTFDYGEVPPIERPPPERTVPITPQPT